MITKYLKYIAPAAALVLSLGTTSCVGDLDVEPIDPSTNMTADAEGLLNKCYANLGMTGQQGSGDDIDVDGSDGGFTGFLRQLFNSNELTTDEAICSWGDDGISSYNFNSYDASHPMLQTFYYRVYFGIDCCNHYLEVMSGHDATMTAEARFLRAYYYYVLMDAYGNVPFTEVVTSEKPKQISRADLYTWIENELLECEPDLLEPAARTFGQEGYGRADKAAAWLLLSRLYLNAEVYTGTAQWQKAVDYAQKVIDSPYHLFTTGSENFSAYQMLFMGNNGENGASVEAILPVLQDGLTTKTWGGVLFIIAANCRSDMPSLGTTEQWAGNRARPDLLAKFFPNGDAPNADTDAMVAAAGDDRALFYGIDRTLDIESSSEFAQGYSVMKFTNLYSDGGTPHNSQFVDTDFFLLRYAEAYLNYAEATARLSGTGNTTPQGTAYINKLRERAHTTTKSIYSLDEVCDEWSREFYFEGRRRTDLIRFGKFGGSSDYKWTWKGGVKNGTNFDPHYNLFPLPATDLNANPNLTQNPGY